tara:strand:- start:215 stop:469 length:255 start_codon:yes stop_codon:yes gene_type:complete
MPKYAYHCKACGEDFYAFHMMTEKLEKKDGCKKECSLNKVLSFPINLNKSKKDKKVGEVVENFIKDAKEDTKEEKKHMKKDYKP